MIKVELTEKECDVLVSFVDRAVDLGALRLADPVEEGIHRALLTSFFERLHSAAIANTAEVRANRN